MNQIAVIEFLINSGASLNLINNGEYTALDIGMFNSLVISIYLYNIYYLARVYGYDEVAKILKAAGGVTNIMGK
jgi:hypothetical protein